MSFRLRVLAMGALVALPLLIFAIASAAQEYANRERELAREQTAVARAAAVAVQGFLDGELASVRALAVLPEVRTFPNQDVATLEAALRPVFDAFPNLETLGLIGLDGWNVVSLTRSAPVAPRTIYVADRAYFQQALATGRPALSPAVVSRVRPGVPVVAIAVPSVPAGSSPSAASSDAGAGAVGGTVTTPDAPAAAAVAAQTQPVGVFVGTLALASLQERARTALPDSRFGLTLLDSDGFALVSPGVDFSATREMVSLRGRPDVDSALSGDDGSRRVMAGGEELLVGYAPVSGAGWGVLIQVPAQAALTPIRLEGMWSVGILTFALAMSFALAWVLTGKLAASYRQVEQALQTRDDFLAAVAHDLKNPLASVKVQAQVLDRRARRAETLLAGPVREAAERIDITVTRAAALVDELMDIARQQAGQSLALERAGTDLTALARETAAEYEATSTVHRVVVEAPEAPLIGEWDTRRLRRVLENLLSNAIKYSPDGGEVRLGLTHDLQRDIAVVTVTDQGIGIPSRDLPALFQRFRRGSNVTGRISGTGIGLASVRYIVESHGGTVRIESKEGAGTCVTVELPLGSSTPASMPPPSPSPPPVPSVACSGVTTQG